jgi:Concanavalin A-like lectin/glucanases superfamily
MFNRPLVTLRVMVLALLLGACQTPAMGAVNILLVTANNGWLTALESGRKSSLEASGFTVNTIWAGAWQSTYNTAFTNNHAVYVPDDVDSNDIGHKLRLAPIGVLNEEPALADELGICSGSASTTSSWTVWITNNSHYITNVFSTGSFTLASGGCNVNRMGGSTAPGGQVLATVGGVNSIVAIETGATLANTHNGNNTAAGRRVQFPLPISQNSGVTLSANTYTLAYRMIAWAAGLDRALVAHWKLNETSGASAADSSGFSANGTVTGTANWAPAVLNNGFQFNGSTRIQTSGLFSNPSNVSVAAWANLTSADTGGAEIISLGNRFLLRVDQGSVTKATFYTGSSWVTASISKTFAGTGWHHFAATFDDAADALKLYVDGDLVATQATASSISYAGGGSNTVIGRHGLTGETDFDFTGTIDDVRVYNYALTAAEVAELHGFVGHWKLAETSGATAADSSYFGQNGGVVGGPAWSSDCGGAGVFNFNGTTQYVSIPSANHLRPTAMLAITAWIKGDAWGSGTDNDTILRKGDDNPNNFALAVSDGRLELLLDGNDGTGIRSNALLATGQWYHVAATWDGVTARLYINGQLDHSAARSGAIGADTRPLYIGGRVGADRFDGMLRDVRLYNRPLTATEIARLAGLVSYWALSETSGTTAIDSSPAANHAAYINGVVLNNTGPYPADGARAARFDGTNDYVNVPNETLYDITERITIVGWFQVDAFDKQYQTLIAKGDTAWRVSRWGTTDVLHFSCNGLTPNQVNGATNVNDGKWHHFACVYDGAALYLYVDGLLDAAIAASGTIDINDLAVQIGANVEKPGREFNGSLHGFRVYNRALCPLEIAELYGLVGHWKLDETSDATAADSSLFGRHAAVLGTPNWTSGTIDNALQLNGSTRAEVGSLLGSPKNVSLVAWANLTSPDSGGAELVSLGDYFSIRLDEGSITRAFFYNGTIWASVSVNQTFAGAGWHHFAAVFNDDDDWCKLYVDGVEAASLATTATIPYAGLGTKTVIGTHGNGSTNWDFVGKIDDVRIYNRPLSPDQILSLHNSGTGGFGGVKIIKWVEIQ